MSAPRGLGAVLAGTLLLATGPAFADEVDRCVAASERGQMARRNGELAAARTAFIECARDTCPAVVRSSCAEWFSEVEARQPSVVLSIVAPDGTDVTDAELEVDARPVMQGASVVVDAGVHRLRVRAPGFKELSMSFLAREGEKRRSLHVALQREAVAERRPPAPPAPTVRPITWITGGLAVVALGSFAFFGLTGRSRAEDLRSRCAPSCPESDRDAVKTRYLVADVSLIAGVLLGGVCVWTLATGDGAVKTASKR